MRKINALVVHCAYTPPSMDIGAAEIRGWHVNDNGWSDIGYHYVIRRDGTVEHGRPVATAGAHVRGHNEDTIGICLIGGKSPGGKPEFNYTQRQMHALSDLLCDLRRKHSVDIIKGHRDYDTGKECPCFNVGAWFYG